MLPSFDSGKLRLKRLSGMPKATGLVSMGATLDQGDLAAESLPDL